MFARWAVLFDFSDWLKSFFYAISFFIFSSRTSSCDLELDMEKAAARRGAALDKLVTGEMRSVCGVRICL